MNKKALELFGYKPGELEGSNLRVLMPPPYSAQHNQYIHRYKMTGLLPCGAALLCWPPYWDPCRPWHDV